MSNTNKKWVITFHDRKESSRAKDLELVASGKATPEQINRANSLMYAVAGQCRVTGKFGLPR